MKVNYRSKIDGGSWQAEFSLAEPVLMVLKSGGRKLLELRPAEVNGQSEASSLPQKSRIHQKQDGLSLKYKLTNLIPFGSEPKVERGFEFCDGFVRVIEDIDSGKVAELRSLNLDPIFLPGPWEKIAVIPFPAAGKTLPEPEWRKFGSQEQEIFFDESFPFLTVMLQAADGRRFEIGCGDDLWRWRAAANMPGYSSRFSVCGNKDAIEIKRLPLTVMENAAADSLPPKRTWRFKWYFAWNDTVTVEIPAGRRELILDLNDYCDDGTSYPCLQSMSVRKKLQQTLRSVIARNPDTDIVLKNADAHICNQRQHLDRGKKTDFLHWDVWDLMELFIWANRKAQAVNSTFRLQSEVDTPLTQKLAQRVSQHISGI